MAGNEHDRLVDALLLRYAEPHRYYHTATHIMMVVRHVHDVAAMARRQPTPELVAAALYHDAVYNPHADDNEARSAALAGQDLSAVGWTPNRCNTVRSLIEATAGHIEPIANVAARNGNGDVAILLDADLAILGTEPLAYQAYANGVRAEYYFVDDARWRTGRARVLQRFLDRPQIFITDYMHDEFEHRARANIEAELATLR